MTGAVAINTFREAVRDRVLYNLVFFALLMMGAAIIVGEISIGIERLVIINLGLSAISMIGGTAGGLVGGALKNGIPVTITGTGFTGATQVLFGSVAATSFTVVSSTEITAVSPAQAASTHSIRVVTPAGESPQVNADQFVYT